MKKKGLLLVLLILAAVRCANPAPPAFADELRPEGDKPGGEHSIVLGQCKPPEPYKLENGDHAYFIRCSSGAVILLPKHLVEPFNADESI